IRDLIVTGIQTCALPILRTRTRSSGCTAPSGFGAILLPLALQFHQIVAQPVEALFPEAPVMLDPIGDLLKRGRGQAARPPLRGEIGRASCRERVYGRGGA